MRTQFSPHEWDTHSKYHVRDSWNSERLPLSEKKIRPAQPVLVLLRRPQPSPFQAVEQAASSLPFYTCLNVMRVVSNITIFYNRQKWQYSLRFRSAGVGRCNCRLKELAIYRCRGSESSSQADPNRHRLVDVDIYGGKNLSGLRCPPTIFGKTEGLPD